MLDSKPQESERTSWLFVALASLIIFITAPFARAIQSVVSEVLGRSFVLFLVAAATLVATILAIRVIRRRAVPRNAYLWLVATFAAFGGYAYQLRDNPEEAFHFVQYGLLSLLVYRALIHRFRDHGVYFVATLVVAIIGIIDEWIQWITPSRYWDVRDLRINLLAGAMIQLVIAMGLRPRLVSGWRASGTWRTFSRLAALGLLMLALSHANTPERMSEYTSRLPFLEFLMKSKNMMAEYGYLYEDDDIGRFRSRFSLDELEDLDRRRGIELAGILDEYISEERYGQFLELYSVPRDAYAHEAGVHLFRRNRYLWRAENQEARQGLHYNMAFRENLILEKYFETGLRHSKHSWKPDKRYRVEQRADKGGVYESRVSRGLITRISERNLMLIFGLGIAGLLVYGMPRKTVIDDSSMEK